MNRCHTLLTLVLAFSMASCTVNAGGFTVPDWLLKSVVFLMLGDRPVGTGFLLGLAENGCNYCYLVTAKHVAEAVLSDPKTALAIRVNVKSTKQAQVLTFPTFDFHGKRWSEHPRPSTDLAIFPLAIYSVLQKLDVGMRVIKGADDEFLATSPWLSRFKVRPGDRAFTLGLIPYLYRADKENLVLSRFGSVSLLPDFEVDLPGGMQRVYFVDCPAYGGNSGGPALALLERNEKGEMIIGWRLALLGVVSAFVPSDLRMDVVGTESAERRQAIRLLENTGIAKIVPADAIADVLYSNEQKEFRKRFAQKPK